MTTTSPPRETIGQLTDAELAYVAEGVLEKSGMVGRSHYIPQGRMPADDIYPNAAGTEVPLGTYGPVPRELSAWASEIAGQPIRVSGTTYWGRIENPESVKGAANHAAMRIDVTPETTDLTILHELAHLMAGPEAEHGPEWIEIAARLYGEHIGPEAEETFRALTTPFQ